MEMNFQAYCGLCKILAVLEEDAQAYEAMTDEQATREGMIADLRYSRDDLYRLMKKCKITDKDES